MQSIIWRNKYKQSNHIRVVEVHQRFLRFLYFYNFTLGEKNKKTIHIVYILSGAKKQNKKTKKQQKQTNKQTKIKIMTLIS